METEEIKRLLEIAHSDAFADQGFKAALTELLRHKEGQEGCEHKEGQYHHNEETTEMWFEEYDHCPSCGKDLGEG